MKILALAVSIWSLNGQIKIAHNMNSLDYFMEMEKELKTMDKK